MPCERRSYFAVIPASVRYDDSLPANAKLLYGEITALCNADGYCWASNKYFADLYGVSTVSVSNWINILARKGYISSEIVYKEGTKEIFKRYLKILYDPIKENFNTPIKENFKENNTVINNTNEYIEKEIYKEKESDKPTTPVRHKYGEYENVLLSDKDMEKLKTEFPDDWSERIERLSSYIASKGAKYKNHLATIRNWARRDVENEKTVPKSKFNNYEDDNTVDYAALEEMLLDNMEVYDEGN